MKVTISRRNFLKGAVAVAVPISVLTIDVPFDASALTFNAAGAAPQGSPLCCVVYDELGNVIARTMSVKSTVADLDGATIDVENLTAERSGSIDEVWFERAGHKLFSIDLDIPRYMQVGDSLV